MRNLMLLCLALEAKNKPIGQRELMLMGRELGISELRFVGEQKTIPTRGRHHLYALTELDLVHQGGLTYTLSERGTKIASLARTYNIQPSQSTGTKDDVALPEPIKASLREVLCSSKYVRLWWLRYFMPSANFDLEELLREGRDVIIELVPTDVRTTIGTSTGKASEDTGFRIHSYFKEHDTFHLDESGRREIHEGIREWTLNTELISQVRGWEFVFETERQYVERIQSKYSRLDRAYVVTKHWGEDTPIEHFEALLAKMRADSGNSPRLHIPDIIITLGLQQHLSVHNLHQLLIRLYWERHDKYFFEATSKRIIEQAASSPQFQNYVQVNGVWRSSIVLS